MSAAARLGLLAVLVGGCVATAGVPASPGERAFRERCSSCHVRPDRTRLDRRQWTEALARHHGRVPMTQPEWNELLDYLAPPR